MSKKSVITVCSIIGTIVLAIILTCTLYFCVDVNFQGKFEDFFDAGDVIKYRITGNIYEFDKEVFKEVFMDAARGVTFKNVVGQLTLGPTPIRCGEQYITFQGDIFKMNGKWYKSSSNFSKTIFDYIIDNQNAPIEEVKC